MAIKSQAVTHRRLYNGSVRHIAHFPDASSGHQDPGTYISWGQVDVWPHARAHLYAFCLTTGNMDRLTGSPSYGVNWVVGGYQVTRLFNGVSSVLSYTLTEDGFTWGFTASGSHKFAAQADAYKAFASLALGSAENQTASAFAVHQADDGNAHGVHAIHGGGVMPPYRALYFSGAGPSIIGNWSPHRVTGAVFHDASKYLFQNAQQMRATGYYPAYDVANVSYPYSGATTVSTVRRQWAGVTDYLAMSVPYIADPSQGFTFLWSALDYPFVLFFPASTGSINDVGFQLAQFGTNGSVMYGTSLDLSPQPLAGSLL